MRLTEIRRHPIKGIGSETLTGVTLEEGRPLPGDRAWAVEHTKTEEKDGWLSRRNFLVVASGPKLAAVRATSGTDGITLTHPEVGTQRFVLPGDGDALIDWVRPLWPEDRPAPVALREAPDDTGMPDNGYASVAILTQASIDALTKAAGAPVDRARFRANLILDGAEPWAEFDWIGRRLAVGPAVLEVTERIGRCRATEASPETGERDIDTLKVLRDNFGHTDFGVYAKVVSGGPIVVDGEVALL